VRFSFVHIGGLRENQAASIESQAIHPIQLFFGPTLTHKAKEKNMKIKTCLFAAAILVGTAAPVFAAIIGTSV
jgi:hypothetical protein